MKFNQTKYFLLFAAFGIIFFTACKKDRYIKTVGKTFDFRELYTDQWGEYYKDQINKPLVKIITPENGFASENPFGITIEKFNVDSVMICPAGLTSFCKTKLDFAPYEAFSSPKTGLSDSFCLFFKSSGYKDEIITGIFLPYYDKNMQIAVWGLDKNKEFTAYDEIEVYVLPEENTGKGDLMGDLWITYYFLSEEEEYSHTTPEIIYNSKCEPIAEADYSFISDMCIEGSGKLKDGTVVNYASKCTCGVPCLFGGILCYKELNPRKMPWGMGSRHNPLIPFRSVAVDNKVIPFGTTLYIPAWDGMKIPYIDGIGGFIHDGCFRADDVGGAIKNDHFDFFAGTRSFWLYFEKIFRSRHRFTVYENAGRCAYLKRIKNPADYAFKP